MTAIVSQMANHETERRPDLQRSKMIEQKKQALAQQRRARRDMIMARFRNTHEISTEDKGFLRKYFPPDYESVRIALEQIRQAEQEEIIAEKRARKIELMEQKKKQDEEECRYDIHI